MFCHWLGFLQADTDTEFWVQDILGINTCERNGEEGKVRLSYRFFQASVYLENSSVTNVAHVGPKLPGPCTMASLSHWTSATQDGHDLKQGCCLQLWQTQPRGADTGGLVITFLEQQDLP